MAIAYAKINLCLEVLQKDSSGYHKIDTIMQEVGSYGRIPGLELFDSVKVRLDSEYDKVYVDSSLALDWNTRSAIFSSTKNILWLIRSRSRKNFFGDVDLFKSIPVGSGLGGASSDAALIIRELSEMLKLNYSVSELDRLGSLFGKDVPFFFHGGLCRATGYGEVITELSDMPATDIFLICPDFSISTKDAYARLSSKKHKAEHIDEVLSCLSEKNYGDLPRVVHNDFEPLVLEEYPSLQSLKIRLGYEGVNICLSGSGSSFFGFADDESEKKLLSLVDSNRFKLYFTRTRQREN